MKQLAWITILLLIIPNVALSDNAESKFIVDVVVAGDQKLKSSIMNHITNELTSLGDVEINGDNPSFRIYIIAIEAKTQDGHKTGVSMAVTFANYEYANALCSMAMQSYKGKAKEKAEIICGTNLCTLEDQYVRHFDMTDLKIVCSSIVEDFNNNCLILFRRVKSGRDERV